MTFSDIVKWIPVMTVQALAMGVLYVYLLIVKRWKSEMYFLQVLHFLVYILLLMYEVCFMRTVVAPIPLISTKFRGYTPDLITPELLVSLSIRTRTPLKQPRYCQICRIIQPDRTYHCDTCKLCVLRMDHHCFWMNSCIHFGNYKFFVLCQWYGAVTCLAMTISCFLHLVDFKESKFIIKSNLDFYTSIPMLLVVLFALLVVSFYYIWLICKNQTLMERAFGIYLIDGRRYDKLFNLGCRRNWTQLFGECFVFMFIPIFTNSGNGETFDVSIKDEEVFELVESSPSTA